MIQADPQRRALFVVLTVLVSACAMAPETRGDLALKQAMEAASADVTLEQVAEAARTLPADDLRLDPPPCLVCVEAVHCEGDTCGIWVRRYAEQVLLRARRDGARTTLRVWYGSARHGGVALRELWRAIDPPTAEAALARAARLEVAALEGPPAFENRWAPVAQMYAHGGEGPHLGVGLRMGVLRWHSHLFFMAYVLDVGSQLRAAEAWADFSFQVRLGLSRWNRQADENFARPQVAAYLHAAPVLELDRGASFGWRAGVGFSLATYKAPAPYTYFVEGYAMQIVDQGAPFIGLMVGLGT